MPDIPNLLMDNPKLPENASPRSGLFDGKKEFTDRKHETSQNLQAERMSKYHNRASFKTGQIKGAKMKLKMILDDPGSSELAFFINFLVIVVILLSVTVFVIQTLPSLQDNESTFKAVETGCIIFFSVEFVARFYVATDLKFFFLDPWTIIDGLAILPFYIELIVRLIFKTATFDAGGVSFIRIVRMARIFRLIRRNDFALAMLRIFATTMDRSFRSLIVLVFLGILGAIVFSTFLFYFERGQFDEETEQWTYDSSESSFDNVFHGIYFVLVTMTSLGYGDQSLNTWGK